MITKEFIYDVAFSFTESDEKLAYSLYRLLKPRLKCFIYSEEQKKLAGRNGEDLFNSVYSKESRIVVILFNNKYGTTKWTRIEESAIRNRGFDDGYDFVILIPTIKEIIPPKWLPKNRLWVGMDRWGIESAAGVIESKVQEFGGTVTEESIADKAARSEALISQKVTRDALLKSSKSMNLANHELNILKEKFKNHVDQITSKTENWNIKCRENRHDGLDILSYGYMLYFHYYQQFAYSSQDTYLQLFIYYGYIDENGNVNDPFREHKMINNVKFRFDINELDQSGWSYKDSKRLFFTSQQLADEWFAKFLPYMVKGMENI